MCKFAGHVTIVNVGGDGHGTKRKREKSDAPVTRKDRAGRVFTVYLCECVGNVGCAGDNAVRPHLEYANTVWAI